MVNLATKQNEPLANVSRGERWVSMAGGSALALYGLTRRSPLGALLAMSGGYLMLRGLSGRCTLYEMSEINTDHLNENTGLHIEKSVTVNEPLETAFAFWEKFDYLQRSLKQLQPDGDELRENGHGRQTLNWFSRLLFGQKPKWPLEIVERRENELIEWQSVSESGAESHGTVTFVEAPGGRGTEVKIRFNYKPALGILGYTAASLGHKIVAQQVKEELRRYKRILETGVLPSVDGQPSARLSTPVTEKRRLSRAEKKRLALGDDTVLEASLESFPASDSPAWRDSKVERPKSESNR